MAITNRFASEQYVLDQINNNPSNQTDWNENNSENNAYIKNRTHYKETITLEWDGNTEGYEIYENLSSDISIKYIRLLNHIPAQLEDLTTLGICTYQDGDFVYTSNDTNLTDLKYYGHYYPKFEDCAECVQISFANKRTNQSNIGRVLFVLTEGKLKTSSVSEIYDTNEILPIGVYFIQIISNSNSQTTLSYSFSTTKKIAKDFMVRGDLATFSEVFNDTENNKALFAYSHTHGQNNYVGPYNSAMYFDQNEYISVNSASSAEGSYNKIYGNTSHGEGSSNILALHYSHIEGYKNQGGDPTRNTINGEGCHIEGYCNSIGSDSDGVHVEGTYCKASGTGSHAEGGNTSATTDYAHSQNKNTQATAYCASASGLESKATGSISDAGGSYTEANHTASFTRGQHTKSGCNYQSVFGIYNDIVNDSLLVVGNGTGENDRVNAFVVKQDGSVCAQTQGISNESLTRKDYVDNLVNEKTEQVIINMLNVVDKVDSWDTVQKIVRMGYAPYVFKVGDQLVCNHTEFGKLVWDIIGINHDTPVDSQYTNSLTLQLHNTLNTEIKEFDAREAIFCFETNTEAGSYYLKHNNKVDGTGSFQYLKFTIPENQIIPAGSLLCMGTGTAATIITDCFSIDNPILNLTITSTSSQPSTDTIFLGESNYYKGWNAAQSDNNYTNSNIRAFLNSNESSLNWTPKHKCDMPPSYKDVAGFMYGLDDDFKQTLGQVNKKVYNMATNNIENCNDFIFLLSRPEVYGGYNPNWNGENADEGTVYEYYLNNSNLTAPGTGNDINRIKYDLNNIAQKQYLRSIHSTSAGGPLNSNLLPRIGSITANGGIAVTGTTASQTTTQCAIAPCCCIV